MINFFTEPDPLFGGVSVATGIFWLLLLAGGIYLLTRWRDANPVRSRFGRQVGIVSAVLGAIGLVLLALNLFQVSPFNIRLWIYLIGFASLGYLAYAIYVYTSRLPAQIAAARPPRTVRGPAGRGGARTYAANSTPAEPRAPRPPRPVATTTRREARRDKKRKSR